MLGATENWFFLSHVLNLLGIFLTALPPFRVAYLQWKGTRWEPKRESGEFSGIDDLKAIVSNYFLQAARRVRVWHLGCMAIGIILNAASALLRVVLTVPTWT